MQRKPNTSTQGLHGSTKRSSQSPTGVIQDEELEPLAPAAAIEMYLADREQELRESSLRTHRSALSFFEQWCTREDLENLNDLTGRQLHQYRVWRREEAPKKTESLSPHTEQTQQNVLRAFIQYCERINAVKHGLHVTIQIPTVPDDQEASSDEVDAEQAQAVLDHLSRFKYASLEHVAWAILAGTGIRIGTLVGLDVDDFRPTADIPHLRIRHRPETDTGLKNGKAGERLVAVSEQICAVVDDYLDEVREDVTDDHGRNPLLTTRHGRVSRGTIRKYVYQYTRPCAVGEGCPHDRDPDTCEAAPNSQASKCPSSKSPHAIRRGYISHALASGVDISFVGGKVNATEEVIRNHYDVRDEHERLATRAEQFDHAHRDNDSYGGR